VPSYLHTAELARDFPGVHLHSHPAPSGQEDLARGPSVEGVRCKRRAVVQPGAPANISTGFGVAEQAGRAGGSPTAEHIWAAVKVASLAGQWDRECALGFTAKPLRPGPLLLQPRVCSSAELMHFGFCGDTPGA